VISRNEQICDFFENPAALPAPGYQNECRHSSTYVRSSGISAEIELLGEGLAVNVAGSVKAPLVPVSNGGAATAIRWPFPAPALT
jgi:hypothetical protein